MNDTLMLDDVRLAIRLGFFREARAALAGADLPRDAAARCNLLGLACEGCGDVAEARRWFGRARRIDPGDRAADQNLRRQYELAAFGRTACPPALGDERPALGALLRARFARSRGRAVVADVPGRSRVE